jgi:hypothetical protein
MISAVLTRKLDVRDVGAGGSNPLSPTSFSAKNAFVVELPGSSGPVPSGLASCRIASAFNFDLQPADPRIQSIGGRFQIVWISFPRAGRG